MQKINHFNQYLLEKYPTVWNTRIVWMLVAGLLVHILFFIIGYLSHINPVSLQKSNVTDDYFRDGIILVHLIISILMIVGWLIMMFKNNAFKNFYPSSKGKLFSQFLQYFVIIFVCTTFYFSYMVGFRMLINNKYPDAEMQENIEIINRGNAFLSQDPELYTLDNRLSPRPFYELYCETDIKKIDRNKTYFVFYNRVYQYYSVYSKTSYKKDEKSLYIIPEPERSRGKEAVYSSRNDHSETFYFKKEVVDVSQYIKSYGFTYYNFSEVLYENNVTQIDEAVVYYDKNQNDYQNIELKNKKAEINRKTAELLDKNDPAEIEKLLSRFIKISDQFKIDHNLNPREWTKMVYAPKEFNVRYFIKKYKPVRGEEYDPNNSEYYAQADTAAIVDATAPIVDESGTIVEDSIRIKDFNPEINEQISPENYFKNNTTNYYYYTDDLKKLLISVDKVKSDDFFTQNIHIYLWIAFFLSTFIFSFRITGLKSLLFSVLTVGILVLSVTLVTVLYSVSVSGKEEFFVAYIALFLLSIILLIPLKMINRFNKLVTSIFVNISLNGFVLFVFLVFGIVSLYQEEACKARVYNANTGVAYEDCQNIIEYLNLNLSYMILISGFIFMYFYSAILQKWKARAE